MVDGSSFTATSGHKNVIQQPITIGAASFPFERCTHGHAMLRLLSRKRSMLNISAITATIARSPLTIPTTGQFLFDPKSNQNADF
jgi:hypothetical protein